MLRCTDSRINSIFENNSLIGRNLAVAILFNKEYFCAFGNVCRSNDILRKYHGDNHNAMLQ